MVGRCTSDAALGRGGGWGRQEGCEEGLIARNYLNEFIKHLITGMLPSQQPFLRSITCWTLSRYANCIARQSQLPDNPAGSLLEPMVNSILTCMMDSSAKVQEAVVAIINAMLFVGLLSGILLSRMQGGRLPLT